jgi:hypothetical protein
VRVQEEEKKKRKTRRKREGGGGVKEDKGKMKEIDGEPAGLAYIPGGYDRRTNMVVRWW